MLGINGQWDVTDSWNVSARYGMARYRTNFVIKSVGTFDDLSDTYRTDIKDRHDGRWRQVPAADLVRAECDHHQSLVRRAGRPTFLVTVDPNRQQSVRLVELLDVN